MSARQNYLRPLAFDKTMEGRPFAAQDSWLFSSKDLDVSRECPYEIRDEIFSYVVINKNDLATLALVNSDCRQLARSHQFRVVTLDGSRECENGILAWLLREAFERRQNSKNHGRTRRPSLGACIRVIIAREDGIERYINAVNALMSVSRNRWPPVFGYHVTATDHERMMAQQWPEHHNTVIEYSNQVYRLNVLSVFASLPHLVMVKTLPTMQAGGLVLNQYLLNSFTGSTIRHLQLSAVMTERCPCIVNGVVWPLTSLDIYLEWLPPHERSQGFILDASPFCQSILGLCCSTLERLRMRIPTAKKDENDYHSRPVSFSLSFPQLRQLDVLEASCLHRSALESLLTTSKSLSALTIDFTTQIAPRFSDKLALKSARGAAGSFRHTGQYACPDVLNETDQTRGLLNRLLPLLSRCHAIKRMSMVYEGSQQPNSSLQAPERPHTSSLKELHMGAGPRARQIPPSSGWVVDHAIIRSTLPASAKQLRRLIFCRDVYTSSSMGYCYSISTQEHVRHMAAEAAQYGVVFHLLNFVHIGGLSFQIIREDSTVVVNHLTKSSR